MKDPGSALTLRGTASTAITGADMQKRTCTIEGCEKPLKSRGWCAAHYERWREYGDPLGYSQLRSPFMPMADRFERAVDKSGPVPEYAPHLGPCWIWISARHPSGYGAFGKGYAHRASYELHVGPIPDGLHIDHLCRVKACVNPAHLEAVTPAENTRRGDAGKFWSSRTHCVNGHEFTPENTVVKNNYRQCQACRRANEVRRNARLRARNASRIRS